MATWKASKESFHILKKKKKDAGKEPGNAENMVLTVFLSEYQGCHLLLVASMNSLNVLQ